MSGCAAQDVLRSLRTFRPQPRRQTPDTGKLLKGIFKAMKRWAAWHKKTASFNVLAAF
jgi:hypothetical protein